MTDLVTPKRQQPKGSPAWMATFADLMSLLMCFFVLLLAFSEMDVLKFKQIAGSMKYAFGVQNKIDVKDIPRGTSVIATEFRPGKPEPTPIEVIQQETVDPTKEMLDFHPGESSRVGGSDSTQGPQRGGISQQTAESPRAKDKTSESESDAEAAKQISELAKKVALELEDQIKDGAIEVEGLGQQLIIRIREKGAFPSESAFLQPKFRPALQAVATLLKDVPGIITVTGHTDNTPISNELYRSSWELSTQRAVAVGHELARVEGFEPYRMELRGVAGYHPVADNDSKDGRALNRRVEIAINQGKAKESDEIAVTD